MYPSKQQQTKQMLLKNGWTIADNWHCWPHPTTWPSWLPRLALSPTSAVPFWPCHGPHFIYSCHQPWLHPWLSSCCTPYFKQMHSLSSLSPNFKICTQMPQYLSSYALQASQPQHAQLLMYLKANGRLLGLHRRSFPCLGICWTRLKWLGRQDIMG